MLWMYGLVEKFFKNWIVLIGAHPHDLAWNLLIPSFVLFKSYNSVTAESHVSQQQ